MAGVKSEGRRPKSEAAIPRLGSMVLPVKAPEWPSSGFPGHVQQASDGMGAFGLRASGFFRPSVFGFRI
jgi:hypothetical protein